MPLPCQSNSLASQKSPGTHASLHSPQTRCSVAVVLQQQQKQHHRERHCRVAMSLSLALALLIVTVNEKRDHSMQNLHSTIIGTEVNFIELQVNIPKGSMIP